MDYNLKTPTWDFPEFEQETSSNIGQGSGSSSSSYGGQGHKVGFSVDLKLGHVVSRGNESSSDNLQVPSIPKMALGSSKRARAVNNGIQTASCLVDGCQADLGTCREYHRRHKVCERHSKTPEVTIGGHKQRFCQQCSRFHSLEEFDEGKRSCRKRLDGHNRRRRKPQPEPLSRPGSFLSNYQGTGMLSFSSAEVYPTTALANPMWAGGVVKTKQDPKLYDHHPLDKQNPFPGSSSSSYGAEAKQFNFLQMVPKTVAASSESGGGHGREMLCDGFPTQVLNPTNRALSLLSSPLPPFQTSDISLSHMLPPPPTAIPLAHPLVPRLHNNNTMASMDSLLVPDSSDTMFHMGRGDSSSENEASQTLPFCWE